MNETWIDPRYRDAALGVGAAGGGALVEAAIHRWEIGAAALVAAGVLVYVGWRRRRR